MPPSGAAREAEEEPEYDGTFPPTAQNGGGRGARPDFTGTWDSTSVENLDAFLEARGVPYLKRIVGVQLQQSVTQVLRHSSDGRELVQTSVSRLSTFTQVQRCGETLTADDPTGGTVRLTARWDGAVWQVDSRAASGLPPVFLARWLDGTGRMWFRMQTARPGGGREVTALRCFARRPGTAAPVLTPLRPQLPPPPPPEEEDEALENDAAEDVLEEEQEEFFDEEEPGDPEPAYDEPDEQGIEEQAEEEEEAVYEDDGEVVPPLPPPPAPSMPYYDEDEEDDEEREAPPAESYDGFAYDSLASSRAATPLEPPPPPPPSRPPLRAFRAGASPRSSGSAAEGFAAALAAAQRLRDPHAQTQPRHVPPPPRPQPPRPPQRQPAQPPPPQPPPPPPRNTPARPPPADRPARQQHPPSAPQTPAAPAMRAASGNDPGGPAGAHMLSVEEEVFENQRAVPMLGWSSGYLLATDPHAWSNRDGSVGSRDEFPDAPLPRGWAWLGEWAVDSAPTTRKEADADGWTYATAFSSLMRPPGGAAGAVGEGGEGADSPAMLSRRRRWVRTRGCLVSAQAAAAVAKPSLAHGGTRVSSSGAGGRGSPDGMLQHAALPSGTAPLLAAPIAGGAWQPHRPDSHDDVIGPGGVGAAEAALSEDWERSSAGAPHYASERDHRPRPPAPLSEAAQSDGGSSSWRRSTGAVAPMPPPSASSYGGAAAPLAAVPARASPLLRAPPGRASPASPALSLDAHGAGADAEWQRRSAAAESARLTASAAATAAHAAAAAAAAASLSRASTPSGNGGTGGATKPPWRVAEEEIAAALAAPLRGTPPPPGTPSPPARTASSTGEPAASDAPPNVPAHPPPPPSPAKSVASSRRAPASSQQPAAALRKASAPASTAPQPAVPYSAAARRRAALAATAAAAKVPLPGGVAVAGPGRAVDPSTSVFARSSTLSAVMGRARAEYAQYQAASSGGAPGSAAGGGGWRAALWGSASAPSGTAAGAAKSAPLPAGIVPPAPRVRPGAPRVRPRPPLLYSAAAMLQPASYALRTALLDLLGFGAALTVHAVRTYWLHALVLAAAHLALSYVV